MDLTVTVHFLRREGCLKSDYIKPAQEHTVYSASES
jgi:hypothetical protein